MVPLSMAKRSELITLALVVVLEVEEDLVAAEGGLEGMTEVVGIVTVADTVTDTKTAAVEDLEAVEVDLEAEEEVKTKQSIQIIF